MPIFTYVLCKSQIPNVVSEMLFLREFTPAKLKAGQDGFALGRERQRKKIIIPFVFPVTLNFSYTSNMCELFESN